MTGSFGTLVLAANDGSYTYTVNNANTTVQALRLFTDTLTDGFAYTMEDAVGATSSATLTVTIHGANDNPVADNERLQRGPRGRRDPGQSGCRHEIAERRHRCRPAQRHPDGGHDAGQAAPATAR